MTQTNLSSINGAKWQLHFSHSTKELITIIISGNWCTTNNLPSPELIVEKIHALTSVKKISYKTENISAWDSGLLTFIVKLNKLCQKQSLAVDTNGLTKN